MPKSEITIKIVETLLSVNENDWDACAESEEIDGSRPVDPFTTYRFLRALEDSGSVGNSSGWPPYYILAFRENELLGVSGNNLDYFSVKGTSAVDFRADNITNFTSLEKNSLDLYSSMKSVYLQDRENKTSNSSGDEDDWGKLDN